MESNKVFFFSFPRNPLGRSVSYVISEKKVKIDNIFIILSHMVVYTRNNEKTRHYSFYLLLRILAINKQKKKIKKKIKRE